MTQKEISEGISNLLAGLLNQETETARQSDLYKFLMENPQVFKTPSTLETHLRTKINKPVSQALKDTKETQSYEYADIFINHQFYKSHIERLCTQIEGSFACADKSRAIIKSYLEYLRTGKAPNWNPDEEIEHGDKKIRCYWLPHFGTQDQWYSFLNSLYNFKSGNSTSYFLAYQELIKSAKEKYQSE